VGALREGNLTWRNVVAVMGGERRAMDGIKRRRRTASSRQRNACDPERERLSDARR